MNYEAGVSVESDEEVLVDGTTNDTGVATGKRRWAVVLAAILFTVIAAIVFYFLTSGGSETADDGLGQVPVVTVLAPGRGTVEGRIEVTGTLAARRLMPVGVVGEGGRVVSVPVEAGEWVKAGQLLASIDRSVQSQQAQSASAQINVARADAELAQANLDRALKLVERGFVSQADVDRLTATRDAAAARVKVAEAQYRELIARNSRLNIVAPASGLLLERKVEPGAVVSPGSGALFTIAKGGEMEMLARLGEADLAQIGPGVTAEVTPLGSNESFTGQVWQVSPVIDPQDRQGTARIALSYTPELRPGGFATASILGGSVVAPILPESAVQNDDRGSYVFVIDADDRVERRDITLGRVTRDGIVIDQGLTGSEKVVLRAGGFLADGDKVRPQLEK